MDHHRRAFRPDDKKGQATSRCNFLTLVAPVLKVLFRSPVVFQVFFLVSLLVFIQVSLMGFIRRALQVC